MSMTTAFARVSFTPRASRVPMNGNENANNGNAPKKMLYEVKQTLPPQHSLGCHAFPRNTHCGDTISLRNKYFVVDKVSYRFKLEYGKYKRDDTRLYVQEATRYLLNKHLDALLCGDDAVKNLMSGDGDAQTFGEKENDERDTNEKDDKMT